MLAPDFEHDSDGIESWLAVFDPDMSDGSVLHMHIMLMPPTAGVIFCNTAVYIMPTKSCTIFCAPQ